MQRGTTPQARLPAKAFPSQGPSAWQAKFSYDLAPVEAVKLPDSNFELGHGRWWLPKLSATGALGFERLDRLKVFPISRRYDYVTQIFAITGGVAASHLTSLTGLRNVLRNVL